MQLSENLLNKQNLSFAVKKITYFERLTMHELHYHDHYEILYISENERFLTVNGVRYLLNKNSIALIPPYIPHLTEAGEAVPQERILINFREDFVHKIRKALKTDILSCFNPTNPIIMIDDSVSMLISRLIDISETNNNNEHILLNLTDLLITLCELSDGHENDRSFFEVIKFTEENFGEKITLATLAEKFYMSKYTILRKFKAYTGMGLPQYLNTIRIINAKKLLADGDKIINIALNCGFGSVSNFDRVFLAETGISPREYRKQANKYPPEA